MKKNSKVKITKTTSTRILIPKAEVIKALQDHWPIPHDAIIDASWGEDSNFEGLLIHFEEDSK